GAGDAGGEPERRRHPRADPPGARLARRARPARPARGRAPRGARGAAGRARRARAARARAGGGRVRPRPPGRDPARDAALGKPITALPRSLLAATNPLDTTRPSLPRTPCPRLLTPPHSFQGSPRACLDTARACGRPRRTLAVAPPA